jgi:hypothetical protein
MIILLCERVRQRRAQAMKVVAALGNEKAFPEITDAVRGESGG